MCLSNTLNVHVILNVLGTREKDAVHTRTHDQILNENLLVFQKTKMKEACSYNTELNKKLGL